MALSTITFESFLGTMVILWLTLTSTVESEGVLSTPLPNPNFNCTPDLYNQLPYQEYYANTGDQLCVVCNNTQLVLGSTDTTAFLSFVKAESGVSACQQSSTEMIDGCDISNDQLCFNNGIPETSFGSYLCVHSINISFPCQVPFNITKAVPPIYSSNSAITEVTLDQDQGLMLVPSITSVGIPAAEYIWEYSLNNTFFVPRSNQSKFEVAKVTAKDRGYYRFSAVNIANAANPVLINYTVTVNFSPIISLTTIPEVTNPMLGINGVTITCLVIAHPQIVESTLILSYIDGVNSAESTHVPLVIEEDLAYHSLATDTFGGCPHRTYTCSATNSQSHNSNQLSVCNSPPMITNLMVDRVASTNTTVRLMWTITNQDQGVSGYEIQYRMFQGNFSTTVSNNGMEHFYTIENLKPGTFYEFRVRAHNSNGQSEYTNIVNFTTYSQPTVRPYGVASKRSLIDGVEMIKISWSMVPSTDTYTVTGYEVRYTYTTSTTSSLEFTAAQEYILDISEDKSDHTFYFQVRAVSQFGVGPFSSQVELLPLNVGDFFSISITTLQLYRDQAYIAWSFTGEQTPVRLSINITQLVIRDDSQTFVFVNTTVLEPDAMDACFVALNNTDTYQYQFCVIAGLPDGSVPYDCGFPSVVNDSPGSIAGNTDNCVAVSPVTGELPIPEWAIAAIVIGSVLLVVLVFGGCGLYVALNRRSGHLDFKEEEPYSSFGLDKDAPGVINGSYPSRPISPPRSCMSYRHNHHQHQMEWQITNPMDGSATAV